jgi:hypothetical protein
MIVVWFTLAWIACAALEIIIRAVLNSPPPS